MSEYEQVIDEIVKHGVVVKVNKIVDDNYIPYERKYVGCVVELDFSEHDKVFEDKIAQLENIINHKLGDWDKCGITYQEILDMKAENQELKQCIAELESKESAKLMRIEFHADNGEMLTPLEVANSLINQNTFKVDELRELSEFLQVYCNHHEDRDIEPNIMLF